VPWNEPWLLNDINGRPAAVVMAQSLLSERVVMLLLLDALLGRRPR
jgi:hypothetical protein